MNGSRWLLGQVSSIDGSIGPITNVVLIHVFSNEYSFVPSIRTFDDRKEFLALIPPECTNNLPWSRGYFQTLGVRPVVKPPNAYPHALYDPSERRYFDEYGQLIEHPPLLRGFRGLGSYRTIDDAVSKALGIPLAPD